MTGGNLFARVECIVLKYKKKGDGMSEDTVKKEEMAGLPSSVSVNLPGDYGNSIINGALLDLKLPGVRVVPDGADAPKLLGNQLMVVVAGADKDTTRGIEVQKAIVAAAEKAIPGFTEVSIEKLNGPMRVNSDGKLEFRALYRLTRRL
jgi:hypothetical protein